MTRVQRIRRHNNRRVGIAHRCIFLLGTLPVFKFARVLLFCSALTLGWTLCLPCAAVQFSPATAPAAMTAASTPPNLPAPTATPAVPDAIYWKQQLFLIPYKWPGASDPAIARAVYLFVSRDRGASWQKISDAKPEVKAFNYRAEGDGEYWFAVRTLDARGQLWPAGPYQPELRVIVDTTIPRIDELHARTTETGAIDIQCRATDINLNPGSLRIEVQLSPSAPWQPAPLQIADAASPSSQPLAPTPALPSLAAPSTPFHATYTPPTGVHPLAVRATIFDRAGNSAVYQTPVDSTPLVTGPLLSQPAMSAPIAQSATSPPVATTPSAPPPTSAAPTGGWASNPGTATLPVAPPATQNWPAGATARAPFQLWTTGAAKPDDGVTAYGSPEIGGAGPTLNVGSVPVTFGSAPPRANPNSAHVAAAGPSFGEASPTAANNNGRVPAHFAGAVRTDNESSIAGPSLVPVASSPAAQQAANKPIAPIGGNAPPTHRPGTQPKLVGSRTFALEYDLDDNSQAGVTRVELWGTRDGGQTWNRYSVDDDSRSPLIVTVDDEGLYGFKIMVQTATSAAITPPHSGDEPELWVSVDLKRPIIELTSIERGSGNLADHLVLHWRVQDNNLEPRPISLFFSSRATGPWNVIAANLENTGEYAWRVERYVPTRIYLRAEARDQAGNLAAFQTRDPVEFSAAQTSGRLRPAPPANAAGPTALRTDGAH